jgi:hypothetical protein
MLTQLVLSKALATHYKGCSHMRILAPLQLQQSALYGYVTLEHTTHTHNTYALKILHRHTTAYT